MNRLTIALAPDIDPAGKALVALGSIACTIRRVDKWSQREEPEQGDAIWHHPEGWSEVPGKAYPDGRDHVGIYLGHGLVAVVTTAQEAPPESPASLTAYQGNHGALPIQGRWRDHLGR